MSYLKNKLTLMFVAAYLYPVVLVQLANVRLRIDMAVASYFLVHMASTVLLKNRIPGNSASVIILGWMIWSVASTSAAASVGIWSPASVIFIINDLLTLSIFYFFYKDSRAYVGGKNLHAPFTLLACLGVAVYCLQQLISGSRYGHYGIAPPFLDGASAASAAGIMWSMVLTLICAVSLRGAHRLIVLNLSVFLLACVYFTQNRTFFVGGAVVMISFCLYLLRGRVAIPKFFIFSLAVLAGMQLFSLSEPNVDGWVSQIGSARFSQFDDGVRKRFEVVRGELDSIDTSLYLTGVGRGGYEAALGDTKRGMHSQISRTLIELGIPGLFLLAVFHIALVKKILKYRSVGSEIIALKFLGVGIVLCSGVCLLTYDIWSQPRFSYGFAMAIGYIFGRLSGAQIKQQ